MGQLAPQRLRLSGEVEMRLYRISFAAGFAAGYVAGARAGRERYDQIVKIAKDTAQHPKVQQAVGTIQAQATGVLSTAAHTVGGQLQDRVPQMAHSLGDHIPGLKQKNGQRAGDSGSGDGRPFAATGNSSTRKTDH
jgi:hypothetical protein